MTKGIVIRSYGNRYLVRDNDGHIHECVISGKLRMTDYKITNPIAVGDIVSFEVDVQISVIKEILPRKNYIIRKSSNLSKQGHVIAANVDFAILIATVKSPVTYTTFIDRFLMSAEAYRIPAVLIFNKIDLLSKDEEEYLNSLIQIYSKIGYTCFKISIEKNINVDSVRGLFENKTCVLSGHSGVGKSSLIRKLDPTINLKVSNISDAHHKGKHTTTYYEMYTLTSGGFIIDTPGIKGFGIIDIDKNEVYHFFPEFFKESKNCQFYNCTHLHEPNCAIKNALENGEISWTRYNSYLSILSGDDDKHREKINS